MNTPTLALALIALAAPLHARVWTTADNKTFEADYVSATATHVTVKVRDGRIVPVELIRLAQTDRDFVAQQLAANPPLPAHRSPATTPRAPETLRRCRAGQRKEKPLLRIPHQRLETVRGKRRPPVHALRRAGVDATKKLPLVIYLHGKGNNVLTREHLGLAEPSPKPRISHSARASSSLRSARMKTAGAVPPA